jgi:hypothetical protein
METIWAFDARVNFQDGSEKSLTILKDTAASREAARRTVGDNTGLSEIKVAQTVKDFVDTLGYTPATGNQAATVKDTIFRFMAITTNGALHIAGSSDELSPTVESDNLASVLADLNADPQFVLFMASLG